MDLTTLLFIFFLMLYTQEKRAQSAGEERRTAEALSAVQKAFGGSAPRKALQRAEARDREAAMARALREGIPLPDGVRLAPERITISLPSQVLFRPGSPELDPKGSDLLRDVARQIASLADEEIIIEGRAAGEPARPAPGLDDSLDLASFRALRVLEVFAAIPGMDPGRLMAVGKPWAPPAPGLEAAGSGDRLDIHILRL